MTERGLAHVLASGAVDAGWHGSLTSGSKPTVLAVAPGVLYASAWIGDTDRSELAALDAATGTPRMPPAVPPYGIDAMAVAGDELIVAQDTGAAANAPSCLRAFDARTAAPLPRFAAIVRMTPELGCIESLTAAGAAVYLAGYFQRVDGVQRPGIARIDARTGALDRSWRPPPPNCHTPGAPRGPSGCYSVAHRIVLAPGAVVVAVDPGGPVALDPVTGAALTGGSARSPSVLAALSGKLAVGSGSRVLVAAG
jgi:hypothetical protein